MAWVARGKFESCLAVAWPGEIFLVVRPHRYNRFLRRSLQNKQSRNEHASGTVIERTRGICLTRTLGYLLCMQALQGGGINYT